MRVLLGSVVFAVLSGCAMPTDDILNNNFVSVVPTAPPPELVGNWTGSSGPYLMTLVIHRDGTALSCHAWNERNSVSRAKFRDGYIYMQDGTRMSFASSAGGVTATSSYSGSKPIHFVSDPQLSASAPYCTKSL